MKWRQNLVTKDELITLLASDEITHRDKVMFILAFARGKTVPNAWVLKTARGLGLEAVVRWNIHDILSKAKGMVIKAKEGWKLAPSGRDYVLRELAQRRIASRTSVRKK